jgi:hypothetical protein
MAAQWLLALGEVRPDVGTALAAYGTGEPRFKVGQPNVLPKFL